MCVVAVVLCCIVVFVTLFIVPSAGRVQQWIAQLWVVGVCHLDFSAEKIERQLRA